MDSIYAKGLAEQTDRVYQAHPGLHDHRQAHPWMTGALGDPQAGIWFVAENPSLTMIERATNPGGGKPTPEAQWYASQGDRLFREMLVKHRFKDGGVDTLGGWRCYITNVIKEADYTRHWREKSQESRNQAAVIWSPVLAWELAQGKPRLVIILGGQVHKLLAYLSKAGKIRLPKTIQIHHYAYIGQRAEGKLGPMHPERVKAYDECFAEIQRVFDGLKQGNV